MENSDLILAVTAVSAIILIFLIIKFLKRALKVAGTLIVILIAAICVYLFTDVFKNGSINIDNVTFSFSPDAIKDKYCYNNMDYRDSVKCALIIMPIYEEIMSTYSEQEINEMKSNRIRTLVAIKKAIKTQKDEIQKNLKEINALYIWNDFADDVKNGEILKQ